MSEELSYLEACHAMQTGVAYEMEKNPSVVSPKHLRVGVNSALCDSAALAELLIEKGVITEEEYRAAITRKMNEEVVRYEKLLVELYGGEGNNVKITLR